MKLINLICFSRASAFYYLYCFEKKDKEIGSLTFSALFMGVFDGPIFVCVFVVITKIFNLPMFNNILNEGFHGYSAALALFVIFSFELIWFNFIQNGKSIVQTMSSEIGSSIKFRRICAVLYLSVVFIGGNMLIVFIL